VRVNNSFLLQPTQEEENGRGDDSGSGNPQRTAMRGGQCVQRLRANA
jgi:hypothetical protein